MPKRLKNPQHNTQIRRLLPSFLGPQRCTFYWNDGHLWGVLQNTTFKANTYSKVYPKPRIGMLMSRIFSPHEFIIECIPKHYSMLCAKIQQRVINFQTSPIHTLWLFSFYPLQYVEEFEKEWRIESCCAGMVVNSLVVYS